MLIFAVFVAFGCAALVVFGVVPAQVVRPGQTGKRTTEHVGRSDTFTSRAGTDSCTSNDIAHNR
jgi:hypothetical protein